MAKLDLVNENVATHDIKARMMLIHEHWLALSGSTCFYSCSSTRLQWDWWFIYVVKQQVWIDLGIRSSNQACNYHLSPTNQ